MEHLDSFFALKDVCVFHIPHKYSNEMAKKSEVVSYFFPLGTFMLLSAFVLVFKVFPFNICFQFNIFMNHE